MTELALGERYVPILGKALEGRGIRCISIPVNPVLDERIASHTDLALLHLGNDRFAAASEIGINWDFPVFNKVPTYKNDCALNSCIAGEYWIGCLSTAAVIPKEKTIIPVKQRYTRCSVCVVDEHSIITADPGIVRACKGKLDVLCIEPGHIALPGFDYGFIGGASFKLSKREIAFTGRLDAHPDRERIEAFLRERKIKPVYLTDGVCFDCGSAVPLREEISFSAPLN